MIGAFALVAGGTTSACAENTDLVAIVGGAVRNYLRVRGEYEASTAFGREAVELPPRARRIRVAIAVAVVIIGTTSACAENTIQTCILSIPRWNYLRVRGEYALLRYAEAGCEELPPRARRIP